MLSLVKLNLFITFNVKTCLLPRDAFKNINTEFIKMCKLLVAFKSHLCPENMFKKPNKQNKTKTSTFTHFCIKVQVLFPEGKNMINFDIPQINKQKTEVSQCWLVILCPLANLNLILFEEVKCVRKGMCGIRVWRLCQSQESPLIFIKTRTCLINFCLLKNWESLIILRAKYC